MEEDFVVKKNSFTLRIDKDWLKYLKDFDLDEGDFLILGEEMTKAVRDIILKIISNKRFDN